jgi:hypothetical protein
MIFEETRKVIEAAIQAHERRHLNDVELTILRGSWEGLTYDEMAKGSQYEANYLKGDAGYRFWKLLREVLGEPVSKRNFRAVVERWRSQHQGRSQFTHKDATPTHSVNLASDLYYVERPPIETLCQEEILIPGALLRIKASPKMGKTELMSRLINYATNQGYRGVDLKLRLAEETDFESLDKFLQWFCSSITQMLQLKTDNKVNEFWDQQLGNSKLKCMAYFEDSLLIDEHKPNLVLGLDDVDRVYQYPKIAEEFLGLLRTWHEKAKTRPIWERLRLILVHTKEYALLDINQSPFNVGIPIELPEFSLEQVKELAKRHKLNWDTTQLEQLMDMVGGHPYLVQSALEHITRWGMKLEELLQKAHTETGIYSDLLQEHLWNLQRNQQKYPELDAALKRVVTADYPVELELTLASKLDELGLVKWQGNAVEPRCKLYRLYFQEHLKDI